MHDTAKTLRGAVHVEKAMALGKKGDETNAVFTTAQPAILGVMGMVEGLFQQLFHVDSEVRESTRDLLEDCADDPAQIVARQTTVPLRHIKDVPESPTVVDILRDLHFISEC